MTTDFDSLSLTQVDPQRPLSGAHRSWAQSFLDLQLKVPGRPCFRHFALRLCPPAVEVPDVPVGSARLYTMDATLPMWDFSLPEFEQFQAEQAEFVWNPLADVTDAEARATAELPARMARPAVPPNSFGMLTSSGNSTQSRNESLWDPDLALLPQIRAHASLGTASDPSRQDSLLPNPSPADNAAEDVDNNAEEIHQRQRTASSDSTERSKAVNRESQRRFRLRQKVSWHACTRPCYCTEHRPLCRSNKLNLCAIVMQARSQAVEAQLASTTAELRELKSRQHQLEVRNMLLEKVSQLNKTDAPQTSEVRLLCGLPMCSFTTTILRHLQ